MEPLQKQLSSASSSLPRERAKPPQIEAFKVAIGQVRLALEDDCAALTSSSVLPTLFTKSIGAAIHFNRSDSRLESDPEQGALFETIATIEEVVKTPSAEAALLKAGVVKAVPHLLSDEAFCAAPPLTEWAEHILAAMLLPNLVWRAGRVAEQVPGRGDLGEI